MDEIRKTHKELKEANNDDIIAAQRKMMKVLKDEGESGDDQDDEDKMLREA